MLPPFSAPVLGPSVKRFLRFFPLLAVRFFRLVCLVAISLLLLSFDSYRLFKLASYNSTKGVSTLLPQQQSGRMAGRANNLSWNEIPQRKYKFPTIPHFEYPSARRKIMLLKLYNFVESRTSHAICRRESPLSISINRLLALLGLFLLRRYQMPPTTMMFMYTGRKERKRGFTMFFQL